MRAVFHDSIADISPSDWDGLFRCDNPFIRHTFLLTLESSGCVSAENGWLPQHLGLYRNSELVAAMPLYLKTHSYGEFVFDWGWAEAYQQHGLDYYPKLLTAIPFTPSTGPRLGLAADVDEVETLAAICQAIRRRAVALAASGWHLLFPEAGLAEQLTALECGSLLCRPDVQFHWVNRDYRTFDDYLGTLRSSRRKNVKRERRRIDAQGVRLERQTGRGITARAWSAFYDCYAATYRKRSGHEGYLNRRFFDLLLAAMAEQMMLVVAWRDEDIVGSALFLFDQQQLYGRYWGVLGEIDCLHFEACLYQGIEFCIERGITGFDPGTQGEHKLLRGFEPYETRSLHWIAHEGFRDAIADYLKREKHHRNQYRLEAENYLPFRRDGSASESAG